MDDYNYAQRVWTALECRTFEEYLKFYLAIDVCELADFFEKFPQHLLLKLQALPIIPRLSAQACLEHHVSNAELKLELLNDPEMYQIIQPNIRGGICHAIGRYARAKNKYMKALYRFNEP